MNALNRLPKRWWIALLLSAILLSASLGWKYVRIEQRKVKRLTASLQELHRMNEEAGQELQRLAESVDGQIQAPRDLFAAWTGRGVLLLSGVESRGLSEGYRHHQVTLQVEAIPAEELTDLISTAENASPAWRLVSLKLTPAAGKLNGELLLEALDKSPPEL